MCNRFTRCVVLAILACVLFTPLAVGQGYEVSHFAGSTGGAAYQDGVGTAARFDAPSGAFGVDGILYVADAGDRYVRAISLATSEVRTLANLGQIPYYGSCHVHALQGAHSPSGFITNNTLSVWADHTHVYVADFCMDEIHKIEIASGQRSVLASSFDWPRIVSGDDDYLYVVDSEIHRVSKTSGETKTISATPGTVLAVDASSIYRLECPTIIRTSIVTGTTTAVGFMSSPCTADISWVQDGSVYSMKSDYFTTTDRTIRRMDLSTVDVVTLQADTPLHVDGLIAAPGLSLPASGGWSDGNNIYLTQPILNRIIRVATQSGGVTNVAGAAVETGHVDGVGDNARFGAPRSIWGDANSLFVLDSNNDGSSTIRQIRLSDRNVTTLAVHAFSGSELTYPFPLIDGVGLDATFSDSTSMWGDGQSLYVVGNASIRKVDIATRQVTTIAGTPNVYGFRDGIGSEARFGTMAGIWGDGHSLFVTDGMTIRQMDVASGQVRTLAGSPNSVGSGDGVGTAARFDNPRGIWGDGTSLYVTERSGLLRKIRIDTAEVTSVRTSHTQYGEIRGEGDLLYIASPWEFNDNIVRSVLKTDYSVTTIAGSNAGAQDGTAETARFNRPVSIWSDGRNLYVADYGNASIRKISPTVTSTDFTIAANGAFSTSTTKLSGSPSVGYARIEPQPESHAPAGLAIFDFRPDGKTLVSEAAVPAAGPIQSGRIPFDALNGANTGVAIVNPNSTPVHISYSVKGTNGEALIDGSMDLAAGEQIARFLTEAPFAAPQREGTFTFNASAPLSVIALRGLTNERSEFLMTTMPVTDLSKSATEPIVFPHFADGGGWKSRVVLVNPFADTLVGVLQFITSEGQNAEAIPYSIPPGGTRRIETSGASDQIRTGSIQVKVNGTQYPSGLVIFSYRNNGITVTEASVPATRAGRAFRMFAEASDHLHTGVAISNSSPSATSVMFDLTDLSGAFIASSQPVSIPANGHFSAFLDQIPGFDHLSLPIQGVVRVSNSAGGVSVLGLRGRTNERGDFLISTAEAINEAAPEPTSPIVFPHFVEGGGYTTDFVLYPRSGESTSGRLRFFSQTSASLSVVIE